MFMVLNHPIVYKLKFYKMKVVTKVTHNLSSFHSDH